MRLLAAIPTRRRLPLLVYLWAQAVLFAWWAVNFPVQVSPDAITYIHHVTVGPWVANHSVLYDAMIGVCLHLTGNLWLLTLAQTVVYAGLLALVVSRVHDLGVRSRWAALPALLIVFVPGFGSFVDMLWKDVPFAASNLLLAATVLKIIAQRRAGQPVMTWRTTAALGAEMTAITLFRNNGFIVVAIVGVFLIVGLARDRLKVAAAAAAAIAIFEFAGAVVYPAAGIKPVSSAEAYGVFYGDIAYVYGKDPGAFSSSDLRTMAAVAPLSHWAASDNCLDSDPLFRHHFNRAAADVHRHQLAGVWFQLLARDPANLVGGHLCRASIAWRIRPTGAANVVPTVSHTVTLAEHKKLDPALIQRIKPHPVSWKLYHAATKVRTAIQTTPLLQTAFARAPLWSYLAYVAVLFAAFRNRWRLILLAAAPILANQLTVMLANPAQIYRYTVVQLFLGMLFVPLATARWPRADERPPGDEQGAARDPEWAEPEPVGGVTRH